ncbi:hypothetical protein ACFYW8_43265 [Streptomyces sp. NPDC002742]|uniref:hypothetical protein n=1 Tax=Streptomyces sp. NPDC002742 TaxID=3364663 RepID=UPI003683A041
MASHGRGLRGAAALRLCRERLAHPMSVWRFTPRPQRTGTALERWAQLGPARSGLSAPSGPAPGFCNAETARADDTVIITVPWEGFGPLLTEPRVTAAFHHLSAVPLSDPSIDTINTDVMVLGDRRADPDLVQALIDRIPGTRGVGTVLCCAVATRYDKLAVRYEATVLIAVVNEWL